MAISSSNSLVYHYTSADAALSILQNGTLRFTECGSLDDKSEFAYYKKPLEAAWCIIAERDYYGLAGTPFHA